VPTQWIERGGASATFDIVDPDGYAVAPRFIDDTRLWRKVGARWIECDTVLDSRTWTVKCGQHYPGCRQPVLESGDYLLHVYSNAGGSVEHRFRVNRNQALRERVELKHGWRIVELRIRDSDGSPVRCLADYPRVKLNRPTAPTPGTPKRPLSGQTDCVEADDDWRWSRIPTYGGSWVLALPIGLEVDVALGYVDASDEAHELLVTVPASHNVLNVSLPVPALKSCWHVPKTHDAPVYRHEVQRGEFTPPPDYEGDPADLKELKPGKARVLFELAGLDGLRPDVELVRADGST
jgi:hypothetical protein